MAHRRIFTTLGLFFILCASPATAVDEKESTARNYDRSAIYLQFQGRNGIPIGDISSGVGLSGSLGLRPYRYFALEVAYEWIPNMSGSEFIPAIGQVCAQVESQVASMNVVAYYPMGRFQPFLLLGPSVMWLDTSAQINGVSVPPAIGGSGFALRGGGGLDVFLVDNLVLALSVDYVRGLGSPIDGFGYVSIGWGLKYRFESN